MVNRCNGQWAAKAGVYVQMVDEVISTLWRVIRGGQASPRERDLSLFRHAFRENNKDADALASMAIANERSTFRLTPHMKRRDTSRLWANFDGGKKGCKAGAGWVIWATRRGGSPLWKRLASASLFLGEATSTYAEMTAAIEVSRALISWIEAGIISTDHVGRVLLLQQQ